MVVDNALGGGHPTAAMVMRNGTDNYTRPGMTCTRVDVSNAITTAVYQGRPAMLFPDVGFNEQSYLFPIAIQPQAFLATGNKVDFDGLNNWRVVVTAAASGFEAVGADVGIFFRGINPPGASTILGNGNIPAFGVGWPNNTGIPFWVSRSNSGGGVPPDEQLALPSAVADGHWHTYEFRITWATDTTNASISILYDGVVQFTRQWVLGGVLPNYTSYPGLGGLNVQFRKTGGVAIQNFYLNQFRIQAAPTFQALF
jgi:hypothetical protein